MDVRPKTPYLWYYLVPSLAGVPMKIRAAPIRFAGSQLTETRHVCAFFNNEEEEYQVLLPFIKDGFACGDKAVHVVNRDERGDHLRRLAAAGIDTTAAQQRGQFELRVNTETYLRDNRFDQDRLLAAFEQMASGNAKGAPWRSKGGRDRAAEALHQRSDRRPRAPCDLDGQRPDPRPEHSARSSPRHARPGSRVCPDERSARGSAHRGGSRGWRRHLH